MNKKKLLTLKYAFFTYKNVIIVLSILQFLFICFCNFIKVPFYLNHDAATAIRHAVDIWRSRTLFLPEFLCTTTLELDCASFWAAPLYIMTGNLGFSIGLIHLLLDGYVFILIYNIFRNLKIAPEFGLLTSLLIFTPYTQGELGYISMLFFSVGQYEFRLICLLSVLYLISSKEKKCLPHMMILLLSVFFFFITALSSGIYILATVVLPLIMAEMFEIINKQKINLKDSNWPALLLCLFSAGLGIIMQKAGHPIIMRNSFSLITSEMFMQNIFLMLTEYFSFLGGLMKISSSMFSLHGIANIINFFLILFITIFSITGSKYYNTKPYQTFLLRIYMVIFINIGSLILLNTTYTPGRFEGRYHLLWIIALFLSVGIGISAYWAEAKNLWAKRAVMCMLLLGIASVNFVGFFEIIHGKDAHYDMAQELAPILQKYDNSENNEILFLYMDYTEKNAAKMINAVNLSQYIYPVTISPINEGSAPLRSIWGNYDHAELKNSNILIISKNNLENIPQTLLAPYRLIESTNTCNIYMSNTNPWHNSETCY